MTMVDQKAYPGRSCSEEKDAQLARLHDLHAGPLYGFALSLTFGDHYAAEDVLQEVFVRAWRHLDQHDDVDPATFRPWLYTVARRLVIDRLRARGARPNEVMLADAASIPSDQDAEAGVLSTIVVREALSRLPGQQRRILIELYYNGLTPSEVAELLDLPIGTVKSRTHYAKQALSTQLRDRRAARRQPRARPTARDVSRGDERSRVLNP